MLNKYMKLLNSAAKMLWNKDYLHHQMEKYEDLLKGCPEALSVVELKNLLKMKIRCKSLDKYLLRVIIHEDQSAVACLYYIGNDGWKGCQYGFPKILLDEKLIAKLKEAPPLEYEKLISKVEDKEYAKL